MEGKLRKNSDKIEPFPIFSENTESVDDMDEALRQQLIKAADEYEKILNSDPSLDYIDEMEESPELFEAVIQKLKDEKKWVDEEETDPVREEDIPERTMGDEKKENIKSDENREKVYEMLSDEDRKALAIGRRKMAQRRRDKVLKFGGIAAMVCLCLFGVSMTSSANREYLVALWNTISSKGINVSIDNSDHLIEENSAEEDQMYKEIEEKLGLASIKFLYKPKGMEFLTYNIDQLTKNIIIQYTYNDTIVNVVMCKKSLDSSGYQVFDGKYTDSFQIKYLDNRVAAASEIENPNGEKEYIAQFEYNYVYYSVSAIMSKEDFTKLLNNIYF